MDSFFDITDLVHAIKTHQDAVERFDGAAAKALGVNSTDMRCLSLLRDCGALPAGVIAERLNLTRGSTTTALDRLQKKGYLDRHASKTDGRSVSADLTALGMSRIQVLWNPVQMLGQELLGNYTACERRLIVGFLERSTEVQRRSLAAVNQSASRLKERSAEAPAKSKANQRR